ncbi:MAG: 1,4-dihydroxy-2-naphthoate polyprenyltransferase [Bacteroidales bacterium]
MLSNSTSYNNKVKAWLHAFRLRTLPLSVSGILVGCFLSYFDNSFRFNICLWAILTTLFLQILSNLANDYGDSKKGVDNENRVGPSRAIQGGLISAQKMKMAIVVFSVLSLMSGIILLIAAFGMNQISNISINFWIFLIVGLAAIVAAIKYTVGKSAYGYRGLGDLFVFIFFGWVSVVGVYYLNTLKWSWDVFLPASSLGFFSIAVLNLNNMRDHKNDANSGKNTLVVKMGLKRARLYHFSLILVPYFLMLLYTFMNFESPWQLLFLLASPLMFADVSKILIIKDEHKFDPYLKKQALKTFLFSVLVGLGFWFSKIF